MKELVCLVQQYMLLHVRGTSRLIAMAPIEHALGDLGDLIWCGRYMVHRGTPSERHQALIRARYGMLERHPPARQRPTRNRESRVR